MGEWSALTKLLTVLGRCQVIVVFELAIEVGQVVKADFLGDVKDGLAAIDQEVAGSPQADLDDKFHAGCTRVLLEKSHEVGLAIAHIVGHLLDGQRVLVVVVDAVDQSPQLLIFPIVVIGVFLQDIAVLIEEVEEVQEPAFEPQLVVRTFFLPQLENAKEAGADFLIASLVGLDAADKLESICLQGLQVEEAGLIKACRPQHVQMKKDGIRFMLLLVDGMDRVRGIGPHEDDVTSLTVKILIVNMVAGPPTVDIVDFQLIVPMKEGIWQAIFDLGPIVAKGQKRFLVLDLMMEKLVGQLLFHKLSLS